jgi:mRNA-degrading endonuclease HigB of HigAB toxin-antitoxin module
LQGQCAREVLRDCGLPFFVSLSCAPQPVIFNIKGNDYRLVAALQYRAGALMIRFFGTHADYDRIDAETV